MTDAELVTFLQWALPKLGLRWPGYRRVRGQVRKRLARRSLCAARPAGPTVPQRRAQPAGPFLPAFARRITALGLDDLSAYRDHLQDEDPLCGEWRLLDEMCRISVSRFMRDRQVFEALRSSLLPALGQQVIARGDSCISAWSAGCASGEEPYSLAILWRLARLAEALKVDLSISATDASEVMLARARRGCYPSGCLRELPPAWRAEAFELQADGEQRLRASFRQLVNLLDPQDLRNQMPGGPFDLVLCRNMAFTYFDEATQGVVLAELAARLRPEGLLVIGGHEQLPALTTADSRFVRQGALPVFRLAG